jgi:hypothetical protein
MDVEKTLKWIGAVVALGGLALGVVNYLATVRRDAETRNLEARKQYLTRQLDLYTEATRAAAKLATAPPDSPEYLKARTRFWELYCRALDGREPRSGGRHEAHGRVSERPVCRLPEPVTVLARSRPRLPSIAGRVLGRPRLALLTASQSRSIGIAGSLAHSEREAS